MSRRSFNSVRSYFFRSHCAQIARDQREYGGRSLDDYRMDDWRIIFAAATSQAIEWARSAANRYNPYTRSWDRPYRRIAR